MSVLRGFMDELTDSGYLAKEARVRVPVSDAQMVRRMAASGGLGGSAYLGAQKLKAALTGDRGPSDTLLGSAARGASGGALAALALAALSRLAKRK